MIKITKTLFTILVNNWIVITKKTELQPVKLYNYAKRRDGIKP